MNIKNIVILFILIYVTFELFNPQIKNDLKELIDLGFYDFIYKIGIINV